MASRLKSEHPQQSQRTKSRGHYVSQACSFCRRRKSKCDGTKPICTPCLTSGRECSWGVGELAKRPSTKAYGESLRNRIIVLEQHVHRLESRLRRCHCPEVHVDLTLDATDRTFDFTIPMHHSPQDDDPDDVYSVAGTNSDQDEIEQLCAPTEQLVLEERDLQQYGPTSIFRLAPKYMEREQHPTVLRLTTQEADERYVLKIEGSDRGLNEPAYEFDRYLPSDIKLSREEHDKVIDLLFKFITSWCLRIIPELFLRDMHRALSTVQAGSNHNSPSPDEHQRQADSSSNHPLSSPSSSPSPPPTVKTPHYSPMLHNALIALALACSDDPWLRSDTVRDKFAGEAKKYIESECKKPNISVVQALSMIGTYHSSRGDQTIGYLYFGMSWRMAQALGLNVDCSPWVRGGIITPEDKSDRDWVYWTTFANDTDWSLYVGRDACISGQGGSIPLPMPDKELDRALWEYPASNIQPQPSLLSETFVETCKLLSIARKIIAVVNSLSSHDGHHESNHDVISTIDVELNTWKDNLPDRLEITPFSRDSALPHKLMLHLAYWWLFILLHRPFYRRLHTSDADIDHAKLCNRAASHIMSLLSTYHSLYTLRYAPITLVQVTFAAGTVFLLSAVQSTSGTRRAPIALAHSLESAEQCVLYLEETGKAWGCANDVAGILKHLRDILIASAHKRGFANQYQLQHPHLQLQQQMHQQQQHQHLQQQYQHQLRQHQQQQLHQQPQQHLPPVVEKMESPDEYLMPLLAQASPSSPSTESQIGLMNNSGTRSSPYGTPPMLTTPSTSTGVGAADNSGSNNNAGMSYSPSGANQYFVDSSPIGRYGSMASPGGSGATSMGLGYGSGANNNGSSATGSMGMVSMNDGNWNGLDDATFNNLFGSSSLATSAGVRSLSQPPGAGGVEYNFPIGMGMLGGEALGPQPVFPLQFSQQQMYGPNPPATGPNGSAGSNNGNSGVNNNANGQGYGNIQSMLDGRWAAA